MTAFVQEKLIRFQHCDPAGLIFYPKVFEIGGEVIEDWFTEWSGRTPHQYHAVEHRSLPTVKTTCEFFGQVHVSDKLRLSLAVTDIGRSSIALVIDATRGDERCFRISSTLVQVGRSEGGSYGSLPFDDEVRSRLSRYMNAAPDGGGDD